MKSHWYRGHLRILGSNLSLSPQTYCMLDFLQGKKLENNNPELPRIPLFFRFQRFRSCQGVTNSCRSHWKRLQRSNCSLIQAAMGCKAIGKMEGFPQLVRFYLNFAGFFSWDKTHKNGGFTIRNWDLTEKKGEFSFIHGILKGVYGFIVWENHIDRDIIWEMVYLYNQQYDVWV